jgi:hypothetical protein
VPADRDRVLSDCLVVASIVEILAFALGEGVSSNIAFDLVIAVSLAVGLAVGRASLGGAMGMVLGLLLHVALQVPATGLQFVFGRMPELAIEEHELRADLTRMAAYPGPALCLEPVVCWYARRPFVFDGFNMGQLYALGRRDPAELIARIDAGEFAVIELQNWQESGLTSVIHAIEARYQLAWRGAQRMYYIPR